MQQKDIENVIGHLNEFSRKPFLELIKLRSCEAIEFFIFKAAMKFESILKFETVLKFELYLNLKLF